MIAPTYADWQDYKLRKRGFIETDPEKLMKVYVAWQSYRKETPNRGYWDDQMIEDIFSRQMWSPVNANEFEHVNGIQEVPRNVDGCIMVLPARHHAHEMYVERIQEDLMRFKWMIMMLIGDEESAFQTWRFQNQAKKLRIWLMMPRDMGGRHTVVNVRLPNGYPTDMRKYAGKFKKEELEKPIDFFFSGQDTHERRHVFVEYAQSCASSVGGPTDPVANRGGILVKTEGFTQGLDHETYYRLMASAKVVPCPCGAAAPDSFRVYEALESGSIPIVDNRSTNGDYPPGYWTYLFGEHPLPVIDDWRKFPAQFLDVMEDWIGNSNVIASWWLQYKRDLVYKLEQNINDLSGKTPEAKSVKDKITVLISSSPIPSHPSTRVIKETIDSVRAHLPECEILIMQDGIRQEQGYLGEKYEKYKQELAYMCRNEYHNVLPIFFNRFLHQAMMTKQTLDKIKTPLLLFMEHDTPLCDDAKINWDSVVKTLESGWAESVRFHHHDTPFIHPEHVCLAIDQTRQEQFGDYYVRTRQYSQRPHVATVDFYRKLMSYFSDACSTFIEDRAYELFYENKVPFKLAIYAPEDITIKRSRDLNGRENEPKFADKLRY